MLCMLLRELRTLFSSALALLILGVYATLSIAMSFIFGGFIELNQADLQGSFWIWQPWIMMVLAPALAMRMWSDEWKQGTMELLLAMPVPMWRFIAGKWLALMVFWLFALLLTAGMPATLLYYGNPSAALIISGYVASWLLAGLFSAMSLLVSAFFREASASLVIAVSACMGLVLLGWGAASRSLYELLPAGSADLILACSLETHYANLCNGFLGAASLLYFIAPSLFCLSATAMVIEQRRSN